MLMSYNPGRGRAGGKLWWRSRLFRTTLEKKVDTFLSDKGSRLEGRRVATLLENAAAYIRHKHGYPLRRRKQRDKLVAVCLRELLTAYYAQTRSGREIVPLVGGQRERTYALIREAHTTGVEAFFLKRLEQLTHDHPLIGGGIF
jgi:acyl-CoA synthetase (AMP-forming)/AMP-acid ligase II